jgi:hypothetical protein
MRNLSPLQIFTNYYIDLQSTISVSEKRQIHTFVESATPHQIVALLTEGRMRTVKPVEQTLLETTFNKSGVGFLLEMNYNPSELKQAVMSGASNAKAVSKAAYDSAKASSKDHFDKVIKWSEEELKKLQDVAHNAHMPDIPVNKPLAAISVAALILTVGYATYKKYFDKASVVCKSKTGVQKTACMKKFKTDAIKAQIVAILRSKASCKKSKNATKCGAEIDKKVKQLKAKMA